ncbi:MAG TPA: adenylate/guanylate cyclase domain-containing protein [Acidimicrobiales bacterium]|nr:adenylate/guanylate cyclase domain-containing protein [Acidimicrobiales bacterium]
MGCSNCGIENPPGAKFCLECGRALALACTNCGTSLPSHAKFCSQCGTTVNPVADRTGAAATALSFPDPSTSSTTELRHVSVLFCDLVGFTPFSEKRDPEEVREVLSGYFELARAIVGRYGGVVQKFIGDAVMAVWGAPVAKEDDAERAVRAALELTSAVAAYGSEHGTDLQARVGVVTGGAATTETAEEGLVIGDRVNTAARIQSAAPPGCCYVDETTRAATAAAIAYSDAGEHELKGKTGPVRLYQATRVVAAIAGSQRSGVIEAPFIGRDHELRLVKELFHASAERRSARMVLVSGVAGVGKSRLAWEFFKYIDGLAGDVLWHSGRCLSYGEGVSYWALSEMIRARLQISEEDPQEVVAERLRTGLERWMPEAADREFIAPRLGQLLGMASPQVLAREELFAGWRLFFERLSEHLPVVIVIEDLQWADAGMVDFLDHLLEWAGDHAIFLLVLSRPEGTERRGLGLSRRSVTTLPLDPLSDAVMGELLDGLVPGLPVAARARIVERAEGIPLYAIETVRGLLDTGVLEKGTDGALHLVGELGELEIPPGLTALIASRLDALAPDERRLVKECSVLGGSFPRQAIEALSDVEPADLDDLLSSLVRKEVLTVRADKLSPERGQYAFTQSLIRSVAYDLLTRAERKARHLRTAEHLRTAFPDEGAEVAEVIGAHLYDAYHAAGDDPDAEGLRAQACRAYVVGAERAESVGAPESAEAAYLKAAELSSDEAERAGFAEKAGRMAQSAGWHERALGQFEAAIATYAKVGRVVDAARVTAWLGVSLTALGRGELGITRIRQALTSLETTTAPPEVVAVLQSRLASALVFAGHGDEATGPIEETLTLAQHHKLTEPLLSGLNSKAIFLHGAGRAEESQMLLEGMVSIARRHGATQSEMIAEGNLGDICMTRDLTGAEEHAEAALALARRWGHRASEALSASNLMYVLMMAGRLDEAFQLGTEILQAGGDDRPGAAYITVRLAHLEALRGRAEAARHYLLAASAWAESDEVQSKANYTATEAAVALAEGDRRHALETARRAIDEALLRGLAVAHEAIRLAFPVALEAALDVGDLEEVERLVDLLATRPAGEVPPFLSAQVTCARALLAAARGEDEVVEEGLVGAEASFRDLGYPYWMARTQLQRAEWLAGGGRVEESAKLAGDVADIFDRVRVPPLFARARALAEPAVMPAPNTSEAESALSGSA